MKYIKIILNTLFIIVPLATFTVAMIGLEKSREYSESIDDKLGASMGIGFAMLILIPVIIAEIDFLYNIKCLIICPKDRKKIIYAINITILSIILFLLVCACLPQSILPVNINTNTFFEIIAFLTTVYILFRIIVVFCYFIKNYS